MHVAQVVAGLILQERVERDVVAGEVRGRQPLEVAQVAERLPVEQHGARMHEQVDRIVAPVRPLEQTERVAADDAHRSDLHDAALLGRDREELFGLLAGREPLDAELSASGTDGQHDARGQDGPGSAVREGERADGPLPHHDARAREVQRHVVRGAADQEQRAQRDGDRDDDRRDGELPSTRRPDRGQNPTAIAIEHPGQRPDRSRR